MAHLEFKESCVCHTASWNPNGYHLAGYAKITSPQFVFHTGYPVGGIERRS